VKQRHVGSSLDDALREEGLLEEVEAVAAKRVVALQIAEAMARASVSRSQLARRMRTSRSAVDRLLDPSNPSVTLDTLQRAAQAVGRTLVVRLSK
jgi:hypothetical protein